MEYLAVLFFIHSDFSLIPLLTNDCLTESQKFLLHLHAGKFCTYPEKLDCNTIGSSVKEKSHQE